jgi:arylsulfatase A-like enzyme
MRRFGVGFIREMAGRRAPFLLEVATFSPHHPYAVAPRDLGSYPNVRAPRTPAFNTLPTGAPAWLAPHKRLRAGRIANLDEVFRKRVESVQSTDRMIGALLHTLVRTGQLAHTVFVFSSDNGYHLAQYRLAAGKQTAFDTDVNVPLVVTGPGVPAGTVNDDLVENIDLAPTFDSLAHARIPHTVDGASIVPLLRGAHIPWRTTAGIEHVRPTRRTSGPDLQTRPSGVPPTYDAIRTATYTYVRYADGSREYYDRRTDPFELHNRYATLRPAYIARLDASVDALTHCAGRAQCWAASLTAPAGP